MLSIRDADKSKAVALGRQLIEAGFELLATGGTARILQEHGIACERINKVKEGRPHVVDAIKNDQIALIVNTTEGKKAIEASFEIRRSALQHKVCYTTTLSGAEAICHAFEYLNAGEVNRLQDLHKELVQ